MTKVFKMQYVLLFMFTVFFTSCTTEEPIGDKPNIFVPEVLDYTKLNHLVSHELVKSYSGEDLKAFVTIRKVSLPIHKYRDVQMHVIKYKTTFQGKNIIASGLVAIPDVAESFPILSFQNGTNTVNANAPSVNYHSDFISAIASSSGFVFAFPDYLGFGASSDMFHPYMDKKSTVSSIVDMLKAVKELLSAKALKAKLNGDLYMAGYSQGGWATLALQKHLELENKDLFTLKASSCGAGPHNLETVITSSITARTYENPYYLGYVFHKMFKMEQISQVMIDKVIKSPYKEKMNSLFNGDKSGTDINNELTEDLTKLFTDDFLNNFETSPDFESIRKRLKEDSVTAWKTEVPTRFYHGKEDKDILPKNSKDVYNEMIALGADTSQVTLIELDGMDHGSAAYPSILDTLKWFIELKK